VEGLRQTGRRPTRFQCNNHTSSATVIAVVNQDIAMPLRQMYGWFIRQKVHTNHIFNIKALWTSLEKRKRMQRVMSQIYKARLAKQSSCRPDDFVTLKKPYNIAC
jgi:hypothetical protein